MSRTTNSEERTTNSEQRTPHDHPPPQNLHRIARLRLPVLLCRKRPAPTSDANEYIFDVTSDRKLTYAVSIFLPHQVVATWAESHGRPLADSEQYAAVKMRLFRAFDELEEMQVQGRQLRIDTQFLEESLASLGVE